MKYLFHIILYQPLFNLLVFLYNIIPGNDIGLAIIALTIIVKLILHPFTKQSIKAQKSMQELQPKLNEIKKKYKDDKEKMTQEMLKLYREEKINPFASCLPLLLQFPFLIAVFLVFRDGFKPESLNLLYSFISNPGVIKPLSLGFLNLARPNPILAVLAGIAQYWQAKMMLVNQPPKNLRGAEGTQDENMMAIMNKQIVFIMPVLTIIIGLKLPGGLTLYFLVFSLLMGIQQFLVLKKVNAKKDTSSDSII